MSATPTQHPNLGSRCEQRRKRNHSSGTGLCCFDIDRDPPATLFAVQAVDPDTTKENFMSIFGKIMGAIFGTSAGAAPAAPSPSAGAPSAAPSASGTGPATTSAGAVDVAAILDKAVAAKGQTLNWKTSIVDLMKALDLDSSLTARKELAAELKYTGDTNDSASMNIWLHKQVIKKLAENGGKVPEDLKS